MDVKEKRCTIYSSKSACFKQLSVLELELADANRVELKYKKGEHIAKQGSFVTHILYLQNSLICAIDKTVIENLILRNGNFAKTIIQALNNCTLFHYRRLISASQKQLNGRMSDALLHLANTVYQSNTFTLSLRRKKLAELAGMSVMSVVRTLKDFAENNIIAKESNNVFKILDKAKLESYSKYG